MRYRLKKNSIHCGFDFILADPKLLSRGQHVRHGYDRERIEGKARLTLYIRTSICRLYETFDTISYTSSSTPPPPTCGMGRGQQLSTWRKGLEGCGNNAQPGGPCRLSCAMLTLDARTKQGETSRRRLRCHAPPLTDHEPGSRRHRQWVVWLPSRAPPSNVWIQFVLEFLTDGRGSSAKATTLRILVFRCTRHPSVPWVPVFRKKNAHAHQVLFAGHEISCESGLQLGFYFVLWSRLAGEVLKPPHNVDGGAEKRQVPRVPLPCSTRYPQR